MLWLAPMHGGARLLDLVAARAGLGRSAALSWAVLSGTVLYGIGNGYNVLEDHQRLTP